MEERKKFEYLDIVLKNINDVNNFNVYRIIDEQLELISENPTDEERQELSDIGGYVRGLGIAYKYFEQINNLNSLGYRLTEKGIKARELGGHFQYEKHLKKSPLTTYQKIYLSFFIVFGLLGVYKVFQPTVPLSDFEKLRTDFNSLNEKFQSIEKITSTPISQQINDTLKTKKMVE